MLFLMREASILTEVVVDIPRVVDDKLSSLIIVAVFARSSNVDCFVGVKSCQKHSLEIEQGRDRGGLIDPFSWYKLLRGSMGHNLFPV